MILPPPIGARAARLDGRSPRLRGPAPVRPGHGHPRVALLGRTPVHQVVAGVTVDSPELRGAVRFSTDHDAAVTWLSEDRAVGARTGPPDPLA